MRLYFTYNYGIQTDDSSQLLMDSKSSNTSYDVTDHQRSELQEFEQIEREETLKEVSTLLIN